MTVLVRYEAAKQALAEARRVDEVKNIRDKAVAMREYARQAKDRDLIEHATEIKLRAERRAGELLHYMTKAKGGEQYHKSTGSSQEPVETLADLGVTKKQSWNWQKLANMDEESFEARVHAAKHEAAISTEITAEDRAEAKREIREAREIDLGVHQRALPEKCYGVIYADPPWRFEPYSRETGMDRAADNHYPTMTLDEVKALAVPAADDCVLFLWATAPMLLQALDVMAAWGFKYKSQCVWVKDRIGTGYWFRNQHEILLVGTRGEIPAPSPGTQPISVFTEPVGQHSEKPNVFRSMIEMMFPSLPRLELFARKKISGWDSWGNEL